MDRITHVRIKNVRAIESVDLELSRPLTVLIGENGSGKSTIIECLELLRKAAESNWLNQINSQHRGIRGLLRSATASMEVGVVVEDDDGALPTLDYTCALGESGVLSELLIARTGTAEPQVLMTRTGMQVDWLPEGRTPTQGGQLGSESTAIAIFGRANPAIARLGAVLRGIEIHLGFDTLASWAAFSTGRQLTLRGPLMAAPADRLQLLGQNLAVAWSTLKNMDQAHWNETMQLVRLGLGDAIDSINTPAIGGGYIDLSIKRTDLREPIPVANLSDGQLAWLAFVALARLDRGRSLLAIDEPELHLHPSLLGRVVSLLAGLEGGGPVVISTHSDRVLEMLDDPDALRVCKLDGSKASVARIDRNELPRWLEKFGDLGQLRASGYLPRVLVPTDEAK
jgi:predicted ATPase